MVKTQLKGLQGLLALALVLGLFTACSSTAKKPVGAHARAEKGAGMDTGMDEGDTDISRGMVGEQLPINMLDPDNRYNLCSMIHFEYDKSDIRSEDAACLQRLAEFLKANPNIRLVIEGHCDERGTEEYNVALGERRANSAAGMLNQLGISSNRLITRSWGEEKPIATCSDESCWKQNRRAEFFGVR